MKNQFEQPQNQDENQKKESDENSDIERLLEGVEKNAEDDLNNFEKSNNDFIDREKELLNISENDPKVESEISAIKEKYKSEKKKLKLSFLSRLKKVAKYTTGGIVALAFTAHFAQKEYPDYLSKEKEPTKIEWNEPTQKEIKKLSHEYALIMKSDSVFKETPDSIFENRFTDFVATYGPDIEIVHPGDDMSAGNKVYDWIFSGVLRQPSGRAHDAIGGTLFYEEKDLKMKEDSSGYDFQTSSFSDFVAEFSHHIKNDWSIRRSFAYAEDLVRGGFQQIGMYEDPYSSEYQAHEITQNAIAKYLVPDENNLNVDFVDIYNVEQEYYRELVKTRGYEKNADIEELNWKILMEKKFNDIVKDKEIIFQNLEKIRDILDGIDIDKNLKGDLFSIMVTNFPLENSNNNYELISSKAQEIGKIFEMKKLAISDPKNFNSLPQDLEKKFKVDSEYTYASLTRKIFDDDMLEKMRTGLGDENQNLSTEKLYKLNIYGLSKAIEGSGFGYKDANEYSVQWAFEKYESYLKSIGRSLKDKEATEYKLGIGDTQDELRKMEKYKSLTYALESYIKKDTYRLNKISEDYSETFGLTGGDDIRYTIVELQRGLLNNGTPDVKRDFFYDGQSPLSKILK